MANEEVTRKLAESLLDAIPMLSREEQVTMLARTFDTVTKGLIEGSVRQLNDAVAPLAPLVRALCALEDTVRSTDDRRRISAALAVVSAAREQSGDATEAG